MYFLLAWRNIWRNPRRTSVILTAVVIGVWSMVFISALMRGMCDGMFENGISVLTGDIQVHRKGYRDDPVIENTMNDPHEAVAVLEKVLPAGSIKTSRIRVGAVASNARHSAGITLVGINPENEERISFIGRRAIAEGRYLEKDDHRGIVVGKALLKKFETKIGHKLVVMSQDKKKEIASKAFRIVGVYRAEMESTEKQFAFVTAPAARKLLGLKEGISEISVVLPGHKNVDSTANELKKKLADDYEVHTWKELLPFLASMLKMTDSFSIIWYVVAFIAMAFGIVNTTLMAVFERMREFGLLKALGLKPGRIVAGVLTESFFLLAMGIALGNFFGFLSVFAVSGGIDLSGFAAGSEMVGMSRVIYPVIVPGDIVKADLTVVVLGLLVSLYPAVKAAGFTPAEAMIKT